MAELQHITPEQIAQYGVVAAPDRLTGRAEENKMIFDRLVRELVAVVVNAIIDKTNELLVDESVREENEKERVAAELLRVEAENLRVQAESQRVTNEDERVQAEAARVAAETLRVQAENLRVSAEQSRVDAEQERERAEAERESTTRGIVTQATEQANLAAQSASRASDYEQRSSESAREAADSESSARSYADSARLSSISAGNSETKAKASEDSAKDSAALATDALGKGPYIDSATRTWFVWDVATGRFVDTGIKAEGRDGSTVTATGLWGVEVDENGDLILTYVGDEVPPLSINEDGDLIYTLDGNEVNLGHVVGGDGQTPSITVGQVETLPAGSPVTASITGETPNLTLNLGIPQGEQGPAGLGVPTISGPEDAGKVMAVNAEGNGYELVPTENSPAYSSGDIFRPEHVTRRDTIRVLNGTESVVSGWYTFYVPMSDVKSGMIVKESPSGGAYYGYYNGADDSYTYTQANVLGTIFPSSEYAGVYVSVRSETFPDFYINAKSYATPGGKCEYAGFEGVSATATFSDKSLFTMEFALESGVYLLKTGYKQEFVLWDLSDAKKYWIVGTDSLTVPTIVSGDEYTTITANSDGWFGVAFRASTASGISSVQKLCANGFELYRLKNPGELVNERNRLPISTICHMCNFKNEYMLAAALGWHGVELDVTKTLDGVFVLSHESSISGKVIADTNYEELYALNKQLSTLEECLECMAWFGMQVDVHMSGLDQWDRLLCLKYIQAHGIKPWYYNGMNGNIGTAEAYTFYKTGLAIGVGATNFPTEQSDYGKFILWKTPEPESEESMMNWMFINDSATDMGYQYLTETDFGGAPYFFGYRKSSKLLYQ